ncbi:MAG: hypothetical protein R3E82_21255 [Pseudomonadales bacterium]
MLGTKVAILSMVSVVLWSPFAFSVEDPQAVAERYFKVMQTEGFTAVSRFMHPSALAEFKAMLLPVYEAEAESGQSQLRDLTFGPDSTFETVVKSEPAVFMSGFMNLVIAQTGEAKLSFDNQEILGFVVENEQRHVLTRMTITAGDIRVTQFEVLSFIPFEDSWLLQLNGEMQGLAAALATSIKSPQQ